MSTIYMKRHSDSSKSTDSLGSILLKENPLWKRHIKQSKSPPKNKNLNTISKELISAVTKNKKIIKNPINYETTVKTTALLYEITDRINRLAQPRINSSSDKKSPKDIKLNNNRIFETTPRIIELAKPRVPHKPNPKSSFTVSSKALTAIASPRIIELSKPRNKRKSKMPRKRKFNSYAACSARIEYLSKPRLYHQKKKIKSSKERSSFPHPIIKNKIRKQRFNVNSKTFQKLKKLGLKNKRRNQKLHSNSSRSIVSISIYDKSPEKIDYHQKQNKKNGKSTWMKTFVKNNSLSTLSNSDYRVNFKKSEDDVTDKSTASSIKSFLTNSL